MLQIFGYIAATLSIIMVIPYIRDILLHKTKPERASWFIWTVLGSIAFFSQLAKGATHSLWLTAGQTLGVLTVFLLSIKYGEGNLSKRDWKSLALALVGLILWALTHDAIYALVITIFVDCIGVFLTVLKSYQDPGSETVSTWAMSGTSGIFGALAVGSFNPVLLLYPTYIFLANYAVVITIILGKIKLNKK